ncbi:DUF1573 domain-containing protein [Flavivirga spongiicola]|uniref:DUF1573 domain-containing protein n=1 Tax=Flavivirga spongiicola TaxID=421621 RepID=A0ABU7XMX1_9FLAO|nr:DUF1573 domain-containing protein [Flavivirga sp. MEBiC05379]MDO5981570.1 DUF1573 domain-containing protein [Flavivirga sp. MEBiC05379]
MMNKKNMYLVIFIVLSFSCNSKTQKEEVLINNKLSSISFKNKLFDFGEIPAKKNATAIFEFSNTGENPLVITDVKTSCGCTVPEYPKDILKSGKSGSIKVIYDAKYPGRFNKTITVFYNGKDSPKKIIIKGEVPYPKDLNSSIN